MLPHTHLHAPASIHPPPSTYLAMRSSECRDESYPSHTTHVTPPTPRMSPLPHHARVSEARPSHLPPVSAGGSSAHARRPQPVALDAGLPTCLPTRLPTCLPACVPTCLPRRYAAQLKHEVPDEAVLPMPYLFGLIVR